MSMEIVTKEDLQQFRLMLSKDIRDIIVPAQSQHVRPWLKNEEVRRLLNVSPNTIQRLRISGKLPSSKIGSVHYYRYEDIEKMMEKS